MGDSWQACGEGRRIKDPRESWILFHSGKFQSVGDYVPSAPPWRVEGYRWRFHVAGQKPSCWSCVLWDFGEIMLDGVFAVILHAFVRSLGNLVIRFLRRCLCYCIRIPWHSGNHRRLLRCKGTIHQFGLGIGLQVRQLIACSLVLALDFGQILRAFYTPEYGDYSDFRRRGLWV